MSSPSSSAYLLIAPFFLVHLGTTLASESALEMSSPDPISECTEGTFTWQGGRPPYTLSLRCPDPDTLIFEKNDLSDTTFNWFASVAAGTQLTIEIADTGVNSASGARVSNSFTIQPGSDSCLAAASSSTVQQAPASTLSTSGQRTTTSASSTPPVSTVTSQTNTDSNTVTAVSSTSPTSGSDSPTLSGSSASSPTDPVGTSVAVATSQSQPASASASPTQPSGSPDPSSQDRRPGPTGGSFHPGAIAGAAVGSLVAGFGLATGFFCLWRSRRKGASRTVGRERHGHGYLEPYGYPATDATRTRPASLTRPPPHEDHNALNLCRGHGADPVVRDRPRKAHPDEGGLEGAEPAQLVDGGGGSQGTGDLGRRWDSQGDPDEEFDEALDSEGSTLPPPYSQIV